MNASFRMWRRRWQRLTVLLAIILSPILLVWKILRWCFWAFRTNPFEAMFFAFLGSSVVFMVSLFVDSVFIANRQLTGQEIKELKNSQDPCIGDTLQRRLNEMKEPFTVRNRRRLISDCEMYWEKQEQLNALADQKTAAK